MIWQKAALAELHMLSMWSFLPVQVGVSTNAIVLSAVLKFCRGLVHSMPLRGSAPNMNPLPSPLGRFSLF